MPLLNTILKSNLSETQSNLSLYEILKTRQLNLDKDNKYAGIKIFVYNLINGKISLNYKTFNSINILSQDLQIARKTIKIYLNTNVPFKNYLFLTNTIENYDLFKKLISDATQGLNLNSNIAKKIWIYFLELNGNLIITIKNSKSAVAKLLNIQFSIITNHLDGWKKGGINGNYIFSKELNSLELEKLIELSSVRKINNCRVWVYDALTLELLEDPFGSMQKAADFF